MGCKDTVLSDLLLKNQCLKCLTFEQNTRKLYNGSLCPLRALALHLLSKERLKEETSKIINLLLEKFGETDPVNFRDVCMEGMAAVEVMVQADNFCLTLTL